jgi:glucuronate isomerase
MAKKFLDEDFLLTNDFSRQLYHNFAKEMPIMDYHCHLPPDQIASDHQFQNLTQIWLYGDHYKWRAMRTNGIDESYCTGNKSDYEKFQKWAETVPYTVRNPLYHWTHLELQRYFDIHDILTPASAYNIYQKASELVKTPDFSVRNLLKRMRVEVVCTTDDPVDSLEYHKKIKADGFEVKVFPTFRPDKAMTVEDAAAFVKYVGLLEGASGITIVTFEDFLIALKSRHDYFASLGCKLSDHGVEEIYAEDYTDTEITTIFNKVRNGKSLDLSEVLKFKSAMLIQFAIWDWEKGWTQQFHMGALRNNNSRMKRLLGPDTGWDSIGDFSIARGLSKFLDKLDSNNQLAKTILYNLNPADNELMATMIGNFNDGSVAGKVQFGSGWWFLDQKDGMIKQMNALSNMGLLSRFIGMLTDSRSFLSFPRHEYFRRILCNLLGEDVQKGELPDDMEWLGQVVQKISYYNAKEYFNF